MRYGALSVAMHTICAFVGVYNAEGSLSGEVRYAFGKLLGRTRCGLCDVTHALVRRKPSWDAMVASVGVPFALAHLDEMEADVAAVVVRTSAPVVLARFVDADIGVALDAATLDALGGSVEAFERALRASVAARGWTLP